MAKCPCCGSEIATECVQRLTPEKAYQIYIRRKQHAKVEAIVKFITDSYHVSRPTVFRYIKQISIRTG